MAHLLQIFISVLIISILSEAKHRVECDTHIVELIYVENSSVKETLNCSQTVMKDAPVYWKKGGAVVGKGPQLEITIRAHRDAGNFTCWNGTKLLSHHRVLIQKKTPTGEIAEPMLIPYFEGHRRTYIKCMAKSYSGNFTCSWMVADPNPDFEFPIANGSHTSRRIFCDEPMRKSVGENSEYTVSCRKENPCLSTEEYQLITFNLEVIRQVVFEKYITSFFIKDIITPDASECQIVKCGRTVKLTWKYPKTWSTPESYFGLTHQIQYIRTGWKTKCSVCEVDDTTLIIKRNNLTCNLQWRKGESFRIRSKDSYNKNAVWSSWSEPCRDGSQRDDKTPSCNQEDNTKVETCKCQKN